MTPEDRERTLRAVRARAAGIDVSELQPMLPLEHMPVVLRDHGICEAHTRPLVGQRLADDSIRSWRSDPRHAWIRPLVEWTRTGNSYPAIAFDVDEPAGLELLGAANMGTTIANIPTPNLSVYRRASGHAHAVYTLRRFQQPRRSTGVPTALLAASGAPEGLRSRDVTVYFRTNRVGTLSGRQRVQSVKAVVQSVNNGLAVVVLFGRLDKLAERAHDDAPRGPALDGPALNVRHVGLHPARSSGRA